MLESVTHLAPILGQLLGVGDSVNGSGGVPLALQSVHIVVVGLLAVTMTIGIVRLLHGVWCGTVPPDPRGPTGNADPEPWRLDDLLVVAVVASTLNFVILAASTTGYLRYLTATVIFGAVLAGRYVTLWWSASHPAVLRRTATAVGSLAMACFLVTSGIQLSQPAPRSPAVRLAVFLRSHRLTSGVGDFWTASLTTVESGTAVTIRPVVPGPDATLEAYNKGDDPGWFAGHLFQFVAYPNTTADSSSTQVSMHTATATWGPPSTVYRVAGYHVLVWPHPLMVTSYQPRL